MMQYYKPQGTYFIGDCMPFSHAGVFHLYYLIDEGHHQGKGGLGGHQWAHASTPDLVHWTHHPLALAITEEWEGSICTGSTFFHNGTFHAYHGTRMTDWTQHLSHATSQDGIHFIKSSTPVGYPPEGYSSYDYRDPFVFQSGDGQFHMLATAQIENYPLNKRGGCLLQLISTDLEHWEAQGPFLIPGGEPEYGSIPECPDLFFWNGWYYLLFGLKLHTHYRMARQLNGPWLRPSLDVLDNPLLAVMKTAPFGANRRIGAAWVGSRQGDSDDGRPMWGGNVVFRELVQFADGTLGTCFPAEMILQGNGAPRAFPFNALTPGASSTDESMPCISVRALYSQEAGMFTGLPQNFVLRCTVRSRPGTTRFSLGLRGEGALERQYELAFVPARQKVTLAQETLEGVTGLDQPFSLEVIVKDDLIDACVNHNRCIINRLPELRGDRLFFSCENGTVDFDRVEIFPLEKP